MATDYPDSLDSFTPKVDGVDVIYASDMNDIQDAVEAIETALGTTPYGQFDDVAQAITARNHSALNTVSAASVDSSGLPDFIAAGAGLAVDVDGSSTQIEMDIDKNRQVIATSMAISSLAASTTCYLFAEKGSSGLTPTLGFTELMPIYSYTAPGTPSTDQHWFDLSMMKMKRYTGSVWELKQRIFIGEAVTNGSSVTSVVSYALNGRYDSDWFAVSANTQYTKTHNLGMLPTDIELIGATDNAPPVNIHCVIYYHNGTAGYGGQVGDVNPLTLKINAASAFNNPIFYLGTSATSGYYKVLARRGW